MATSLRALTVNLMEASTVVLKNGTGGGAPALDEVAPYTMTNALKHDRRVLWQGAATVEFDVDLTGGASNATARVGGIAGHRALASGGITAYTIRSSTHANGYPPVAATAWTDVPGATAVSTGSARDKGSVFDSDVTARYFRFSLTAGGAYTVGKLFLGVWSYDLGVLYSSRDVLELSPNAEDRTVGLDPVVSYLGDDRALWSLGWNTLTSATLAKLSALRALRNSFILADKGDVFREFIVARGELRHRTAFEQSVETLSDPALELEQLG